MKEEVKDIIGFVAILLALLVVSGVITILFVSNSGDIVIALSEYLTHFSNLSTAGGGASSIQAISDFSGLIVGVPVAICGSFVAIYLAHRANSISGDVSKIARRQDMQDFHLWMKEEFNDFAGVAGEVYKYWHEIYVSGLRASSYVCSNRDLFYEHQCGFEYFDTETVVMPINANTASFPLKFTELTDRFFEDAENLIKSIDDYVLLNPQNVDLKEYWLSNRADFELEKSPMKFFVACDSYLRDAMYRSENMNAAKNENETMALMAMGEDKFLDPLLQREAAQQGIKDNIANIIGAALNMRKREYSELPEAEKERLESDEISLQKANWDDGFEENEGDRVVDEEYMSGGEIEQKTLQEYEIQNKKYFIERIGSYGALNGGVVLIDKVLSLIEGNMSKSEIENKLKGRAKSYLRLNDAALQDYIDTIEAFASQKAIRCDVYQRPSNGSDIPRPSALFSYSP